MKHNLEKFPDRGTDKYWKTQDFDYMAFVHDIYFWIYFWINGFKKELQYFYDNSVTMTDEERKLIKEILGE